MTCSTRWCWLCSICLDQKPALTKLTCTSGSAGVDLTFPDIVFHQKNFFFRPASKVEILWFFQSVFKDILDLLLRGLSLLLSKKSGSSMFLARKFSHLGVRRIVLGFAYSWFRRSLLEKNQQREKELCQNLDRGSPYALGIGKGSGFIRWVWSRHNSTYVPNVLIFFLGWYIAKSKRALISRNLGY